MFSYEAIYKSEEYSDFISVVPLSAVNEMEAIDQAKTIEKILKKDKLKLDSINRKSKKFFFFKEIVQIYP